MGVLVDADALIKALNLAEWFNLADFNEAVYTVRKAQPVDAVPVVHGRWIRVYSRPGVFKYLGWTCDQCGQRTGNEYAPQWYKFCPNCGALMDGKGNGNEAD